MRAMLNENDKKFSEILPHSYLCCTHTSFGGKSLQKFKRGQFVIDAKIDLHGHSIAEAENALASFIEEALDQESRYLLIIHGKGSRAILKNHVNRYLEDQPQVLAFCSAKPKDGGTGALYVLLKKQKLKQKEDDDEET